jgi:hypothetical protein
MCCVLLAVFQTDAQSFIYLKKKTSAKTKKIYLYERISVETIDHKTIKKGTLSQVGGDFIMVDEEIVFLNNIKRLKWHNLSTAAIGKGFLTATLVFGGIFTINNLADGSGMEFNNLQVVWLAGTTTLGLVFTLLSSQSYDLINDWNYETYNIYSGNISEEELILNSVD